MRQAKYETVRAQLVAQVQGALQALYNSGQLQGAVPKIALVRPKQVAHGDFSCTVALSLAKTAHKPPRTLALQLQEALGHGNGLLAKTEIAGPGYLNLTVRPAVWRGVLQQILMRGPQFMQTCRGDGQRILLEYVSANPTGPLHVAHGRGAVTGDVVARLQSAAGFTVQREYYINDLGHQADVLARSIHLRYLELLGHQVEHPADFYPGTYVIEAAQALLDEVGAGFVGAPEATWLEPIRSRGMAAMMQRIQSDLHAFGIVFDHFVSERALTERIGLPAFLARMEATGHTFHEAGKLWFRSTAFGDDKDRVMVRDDGRPTYFASDLAYHDDKLQRGFTGLVNVWGADHSGYLMRIKAGLQALGYDPQALRVIFIQMVSLSRDGAAVRMGKRLGTAVWLREVVQEAGRDATRYLFLMRRADAQMDFDISLASKKSLENPVYYAQMGHARLASIARRAAAAGLTPAQPHTVELDSLQLPEEIDLLRAMSQAPDVVADAAEAMEPHQVVHYVQALIAQFHSYYSQYKTTDRVISADVAKTQARLVLCQGLQCVLAALLELLGVDAPQHMYLGDAVDADADADAGAAPAAVPHA